MSREILEEIGELCSNAAINACWRQWGGLGALVSPTSKRRPRSVVDPEALLLLSLVFRNQERRLLDLITWWATVGSNLISVQRLRSMLSQFSEDSRDEISIFARIAYKNGDRRWRRFSFERSVAQTGRRKIIRPYRRIVSLDTLEPSVAQTGRVKGTEKPALTDPVALLLRLRAGFGLGVKSDLLAMLLGMPPGSVVTVRRMAEALRYSTAAISAAAHEMAQARLIEETSERPVGYFVHSQYWAKILRLSPRAEPESAFSENSLLPTWRFWFQLFAFFAHVSHWSQRQVSERLDAYVLSSQARDLHYAHQQAFALNGIPVQNPEGFKGERYSDAFLISLRNISEWLHENL